MGGSCDCCRIAIVRCMMCGECGYEDCVMMVVVFVVVVVGEIKTVVIAVM